MTLIKELMERCVNEIFSCLTGNAFAANVVIVKVVRARDLRHNWLSHFEFNISTKRMELKKNLIEIDKEHGSNLCFLCSLKKDQPVVEMATWGT